MDCPNCGKPIPEHASCCPSCGDEVLTPEALARKKWVQRERERKQRKYKKRKETEGKLEPIAGPMADLVQSLVAELDEMDSAEQDAPAPSVEDAVDQAMQEADATEAGQWDVTEDSAEETVAEEVSVEVEREEPAPEETETEEPEPVEEPQAEQPEEAQPEQTTPAEEPEKRSMLEQQGTVHINVEEALATLPQEEQDEIPDIRIPEIYARAKYIPNHSQKWAEEAARDEEDDWEGFDPDNEDWTEEEESSHPVLFLVVGIILLVSVLLAMYSYFTSDLTGGIGLTVGSL
ncbi:MAG: zinc ribbon domain-containing protein [Eubacteriales bacterium]|nr:zinc ribbon domain-containing protein [Eubacteriales bacterium]